jgi:hypothetical protein
MTSWSIWKKRNLKLWENKDESPDQVVHRGQGRATLSHASRNIFDVILICIATIIINEMS